MKVLQIAWMSLFVAMFLVSCGPAKGPVEAGDGGTHEPGVAMTTFYPLTYFAQRIAGDSVEVACPVPSDADPSLWQPGAEAIRAFQKAQVIFINGATFEKWVPTAPLPRSRIVDTTAGFKDELLRYKNATTHSHGPAGKHSHEGVDGHTWLDPVQALAQARAVRDGLKRAYPDQAAAFDAGFASLEKDLKALDASLMSLTTEMEGVTIIATHPAYNYLARRYGWNLTNVSIIPDEVMTPSEIDALKAKLSDVGGTHIMLWEMVPDARNTDLLEKSFDATSVVYNPCETPTEEGDFMERMRGNVDRLAQAVSGG